MISTKYSASHGVAGSLLALSLVLGVSAQSIAADFAQRIESANRSSKVGLGRSEVTLLERVQGPGLDKTARSLLDSFEASNEIVTTRGRTSIQVSHDHISYIAEEGWFLEVFSDGSKARYRNYQYLADNPLLALPVDKRLGNKELEQLGREFISTQLGEFVRLGAGEEFVPPFTEFEISGVGVQTTWRR